MILTNENPQVFRHTKFHHGRFDKKLSSSVTLENLKAFVLNATEEFYQMYKDHYENKLQKFLDEALID